MSRSSLIGPIGPPSFTLTLSVYPAGKPGLVHIAILQDSDTLLSNVEIVYLLETAALQMRRGNTSTRLVPDD